MKISRILILMLIFNLVLGALYAMGLPSTGFSSLSPDNVYIMFGLMAGLIIATLTGGVALSFLTSASFNLSVVTAYTLIYGAISVPSLLLFSSLADALNIKAFYLVFIGIYFVMYAFGLIGIASGRDIEE